MRIIILTIAFLFLVFTAQAQVLKSAGVWYFLDVDSMTARPAVLPNGTELAYVVGTKTVYYWNRNTSTWAAYGSTFNRDSIYFDSSIVGSGTASDPWGVDSTLFATIQAVGDSIMAEKQTLSFASPLLGISDGNNVDLSPLLSGYVTGSGTNNRVPKWSALTNITDSNIQDDGTAVSILSGKPVIFGSQTVAGLPTGVDGYWLDVSNYKWPARYNSTAGAWIYPLQSSLTGGLGTAGRVLYTDANGRATDSGNLTYTGTRFRTGGSIRFGDSNSATDTASIEKVDDSGNSRIVRINNPGRSGGWSSGFVFRGGFNGVLSTANTFRIFTNSSTLAGSVWVGNVTEGSAAQGNAITNLGVLNKITSTTAYDTGLNLHPMGSPNNFTNYELSQGKQFGIFIGGEGNNNNFRTMSNTITYGIFIGMQVQGSGYGTSIVLSGKNDASGNTEIMRLQGKDGNICLGCTNAQYKLYTTSTDAYGLPRGTVAQRPTIITSTTPLRFNTDSTALEYGESVGTWRQIATRAYARSLVSGLGTGSVTSVSLSLPSVFSVSGSPVTASGTLSATFTGGTSDLFLRGDGRWMKSLYFNSSDSITFNASAGALIRADGEDSGFNSRFEVFDYGYLNNTLAIDTDDDARYHFDRSRGTVATPTALLKNDRIGGIYFRAHNSSSYRKAGYIGAVVDSIYSGSAPISKLLFGVDETNFPEVSANWRFIVKDDRNISAISHVIGADIGIGFGSDITALETTTINARLHVKGTGTTTGKTMLLEDSGGADIFTVTDNKLIQAHGYGTSATTAATLGLTESGYVAGFATDGKIYGREQKRDTTIYVDDADYDFSAALTTAQISRRYNRVIFWMTTTGGAGSDSEITLHTPDANLMQVEYLIHSVDEAGGFANVIRFGSNNAVDSTNGLVSSYFPAAGDGIHIRAGLRSAAYKYRYSN